VIAIPTTTVTVLGGPVATDGYGDPVDGATELHTAIPAAIHVGREVVATEGVPEARVVRYFTGRLPGHLELDGTMRLVDERTGDTYVIDNVTRPQSAITPQDLRLDLRRVT
jgi:hypothetical protein